MTHPPEPLSAAEIADHSQTTTGMGPTNIFRRMIATIAQLTAERDAVQSLYDAERNQHGLTNDLYEVVKGRAEKIKAERDAALANARTEFSTEKCDKCGYEWGEPGMWDAALCYYRGEVPCRVAKALKEPSHTVTSSLGVEPSHVLYTIKEGSVPSGGVGNSGGGGGRIHTYNIEPNTTYTVTIGAGGAKHTQEPT